METTIKSKNKSSDVLQPKDGTLNHSKLADAFEELEQAVYDALETYSNVHRGSGHNSMVTTHLYEQARDIVLEFLGLNKGKYTVIFCTPRRAAILISQLTSKDHQSVSSQNIGLPLGVTALAVKRNALPSGVPFHTGGGTAKLMSKDWVIWANTPDKFEAGTPAIVNVIAFAKALLLTQQYGKEIFRTTTTEKITAKEILYTDELEQFSGHLLLNELRKTRIGYNIQVPTMEGNRPFINLDNSASTPTFKPIWNAFCQTWHQPLPVQKEVVHEVKSICSKVLGAPKTEYDVIFTSNTTEAINVVAENLRLKSNEDTETVVLNTLLEHSSNDLPWRTISQNLVIRLNVNAEGFIDLNELETLLDSYNQKNEFGKKRIALVAVSGASNVLGTCNNICEISSIVHRHGALLLIDAAQLVAHRKVDMEECGIDYLAFSAHKVYAPFGSGVLVAKKGLLNFNSEEFELIKSSGEENAGGIAALGKALLLLQRVGMDVIRDEEQALTKKALNGMSQIQGLKIFGIKDTESPAFAYKLGVIVFSLENMIAYRVAKELALKGGIGVRSGCHCAHIIIKHILNVSPSLEKFQRTIQTMIPKLKFPGLVRVSFGIENCEEDVDKLIQVLGEIALPQKNTASLLPQTLVKQQMADFVQTAAKRVYR